MNSTNPIETGQHVNGNYNNYGDVTEVQAVTKPGIKETQPVTENLIPNNPELMLEDPAVRGKLNTEGEAIKSGPSGGNNISKPKWTRLIRMDCGPGASKQSGPNEILGKRSSSQLNRGNVEDVGKVYAEKKVWYQDDQFTIAAAGCQNTLADHNEDITLELPRAWEPLDSSKPLQTSKGSSSHGVLSNGDAVRQKRLCKAL